MAEEEARAWWTTNLQTTWHPESSEAEFLGARAEYQMGNGDTDARRQVLFVWFSTCSVS
jgi:hypothetical protein